MKKLIRNSPPPVLIENNLDTYKLTLMDLEAKMAFLQQGTLLYQRLITIARSDTLRRYLAFRIIVNAMSFEDLVQSRQFPRMREIRNVLLAHKQEQHFFEAFSAVDEIRDITIQPLVAMMNERVDAPAAADNLPELHEPNVSRRCDELLAQVFTKYQEEEVDGCRVTNNFLCSERGHIREISNNDLAGCFYRYNSSKALMTLANFMISNLIGDADLIGLFRHAKLDLLLHGLNMAECVFKDRTNQYSINGLREVMRAERIGNARALDVLEADENYRVVYRQLRRVRNKLIGHMDRHGRFAGLVGELDELPVEVIFEFINAIDRATDAASRTHFAIRARYLTMNARIGQAVVVAPVAITPYF